MSGSAGLSDLLGRLYDAAINKGKWPDFLAAAVRHFNASGGHLICADRRRHHAVLSVFHGSPHSPPETERLLQRYVAMTDEDPRMQYGVRFPGKPMSCRLVIDERSLHDSRVYHEVLRPFDIEYTLGVQLSNDEDNLIGLAFFRGGQGRLFSQEECDRLGDLIPHLRRAMMIEWRLTAAEERAEAYAAMLDDIPAGAILLNGGVVAHVNPAARRIVDDGDGLLLHGGSLSARRPEDHKALHVALRRVAEPGGDSVPLRIGRISGRAPLQCVAKQLRLAGAAATSGPREQGARPPLALYLADPEAMLESSTDLLQRLFGLTQREAEVVDRLASGHSLAQIAGERGLSRETVRSQLKSALAKTGAKGQAGLIRLVAASPAWMRRR